MCFTLKNVVKILSAGGKSLLGALDGPACDKSESIILQPLDWLKKEPLFCGLEKLSGGRKNCTEYENTFVKIDKCYKLCDILYVVHNLLLIIGY